MGIRVKFLPGQQKKFIEDIIFKNKVSINELAQIAEVHPRSFRDWKREKLTMTHKAAKAFCITFNQKLPEETNVLIERWRKHRNEANRKGGIARFKKYGSPGTKEGRRRGGIKAIANLRRNGIIPSVKKYYLPKQFSTSLAEFVGIMLGDGGITSSQSTVTLNSEADKDYIEFVSNLAFCLFKEKPKRINRKDSKAATLYYNGSFLVSYLCSIGLRVGNKVKQQVGIPTWVNSSLSFKIACLRGLMDTDGGVFIHRYSVNGKKYMYKKISFSNRSMPILRFVYETLLELGLTPKIIDKVENKKVWLYNESEVKRYFILVGSHNQRLLRYL